MKIECSKCGAQYKIADEKVRGKTFKIRCKKCANVIIVRDKAKTAETEEPADVGAESESDEVLGWHLAIDGETVGPVPEDDVRSRYMAGEIDAETSIWQEGLDDWIVLGEAEVFADLLEQTPAPAAADPFAGDQAEETAAPATSSPSLSGLSTPQSSSSEVEESSPRVESLTGQRNENSVLFSLDSLKQMASNSSAPSSSPSFDAPSSSPSATTATSEGSGLIDIRSMGSMFSQEQEPEAGHDMGVVPSFGGGLGGLSVAEPEPEPLAAPVAVAAAPKSNGPLYGVIGLLGVIVLAGATYQLTKDPAQPTEKIVYRDNPSAAPTMNADKEDEDKKDEEKKDEDKKDEEKAEEAAEKGEETVDAAVNTPSSSKKGSSRRRSTGKKKSSGSSSPAPKPAASPTPPPKSKSKGSETDVDCLLDPSKCKGSSKPAPKPKSTGGSAPSKENLSTGDIKKVLGPLKSKAKSCGKSNGVPAGTKVTIKFSIAGATGAVTSAIPQGTEASSKTGKCVAGVAKKAKFPRFKKASKGFSYKFTM